MLEVCLVRDPKTTLLRLQRPLLILDLAVPRDFEAAIGDRPNVYLYSIDDFQFWAHFFRSNEADLDSPGVRNSTGLISGRTQIFDSVFTERSQFEVKIRGFVNLLDRSRTLFGAKGRTWKKPPGFGVLHRPRFQSGDELVL